MDPSKLAQTRLDPILANGILDMAALAASSDEALLALTTATARFAQSRGYRRDILHLVVDAAFNACEAVPGDDIPGNDGEVR